MSHTCSVLKGISMNGSWAKSVEHISTLENQATEIPRQSLRTSPLADVQESTTLIEQFERICVEFSGNVAAVCGTEQISYAALNAAANRIAHTLLLTDFGPDTVIAIYLDRSIPMLSAMLGVLKAGCAYLPIDPTYPASRVEQTLEDASPAVLITDARLSAGLHSLKITTLLIDQPSENADESNPPLRSTADSLAYLMYTSGSTGKPKGVLVTHRNVIRLMTRTEPWFASFVSANSLPRPSPSSVGRSRTSTQKSRNSAAKACSSTVIPGSSKARTAFGQRPAERR